MGRFAYFYFMTDEPTRVAATAPEHAAYWHDLDLPQYLGGPFADRSGGLITFACETPEEATRLVDADPFHEKGLLERRWITEWTVG